MDINQNQDNEKTAQSLKNKNKLIDIRVIFFVLLLIFSYKLGYKSGEKGFILDSKNFKIINKNELSKEVDYSLYWDALKVVDEKFIEEHPKADKVLYGAIKGALESYGDPYTSFFEPVNLSTFKSDLAGSFDGIGAEVGKKDNIIMVIAPLDDSPAKKAGILAKDLILEIDGKSTDGIGVEEAVNRIRGKKGTKVVLKIFREGRNEPFDVSIIRDKIEMKSLKLSFREIIQNGENKTVAVIRLIRFGDDTKPLFEQAVNEILTKNASKVILDLRNNPGGYLQTAVDLASFWLEEDKLVVKEQKKGEEGNKYFSSGDGRLKSIDTIVLVNGGSASASEILAGALHDYGLVKLIGEKTFGKGSVQELIDLKNGTGVKVTVAKWITPSGKNLNKDGLVPDIEVKLSEEDIKAEKDPQMERALEVILK